MKIGYVRVSIQDQTLDVQLEQVKAIGYEKFTKSKRGGGNPQRENCLTCCWTLRGKGMLFTLLTSTVF